jgi:hypothetical protein
MDTLQPLNETLVGSARMFPSPEVVILYKDFAAGLAAKRFFDVLFRRIEPEGSYHLKIWDLQLLRHSALRMEAIHDTAAAAIVCVSTNDENDPDPALRQWAEAWAEEKASHPCTLVAIVSEAGNNNGRLTNFLRQVAGKREAEFFLGSSRAVEQQNVWRNHKPATMNL